MDRIRGEEMEREFKPLFFWEVILLLNSRNRIEEVEPIPNVQLLVAKPSDLTNVQLLVTTGGVKK